MKTLLSGWFGASTKSVAARRTVHLAVEGLETRATPTSLTSLQAHFVSRPSQSGPSIKNIQEAKRQVEQQSRLVSQTILNSYTISLSRGGR